MAIDELMVKRAQKMVSGLKDKAYTQKEYLEAAKALGWFVADGMKNGLPKEVAFELAKSHLITYGQAMMDVGSMATIDWTSG